MTQVWDDENRVVPVTVRQGRRRCAVVQIKTTSATATARCRSPSATTDAKKLNKPEAGHYAKAGVQPGKRLVELRLDDVERLRGRPGDQGRHARRRRAVDVTAVSKGKGFAGVMKRHNFAGQGASHGDHRSTVRPGSIGACATPARVFKGTQHGRPHGWRAGHHPQPRGRRGRRRAQPAARAGAVPGPNGGVVIVRNAVKGGRRADAWQRSPSRPPTGKDAGSVDLADDGRSASSRTCRVMHQVVTAQLGRPPGRHAEHEDPRRGPRRRRQAVAPEGHRPRPSGLDPLPALGGGGVALGPKPRKYDQRTPKKMIKLALRSALSDRAADGKVIVIDEWGFDAPKTKDAMAALEALGIEGRGARGRWRRDDVNAVKSFRNLPRSQLIEARELNAYDVLVQRLRRVHQGHRSHRRSSRPPRPHPRATGRAMIMATDLPNAATDPDSEHTIIDPQDR